ncbi:unnamed protein product [Amoebophrya sp. A25]|nr:unnamed protein product [Amoebophrya sp. A25]|eukprot:GSA25T00020689001.1
MNFLSYVAFSREMAFIRAEGGKRSNVSIHLVDIAKSLFEEADSLQQGMISGQEQQLRKRTLSRNRHQFDPTRGSGLLALDMSVGMLLPAAIEKVASILSSLCSGPIVRALTCYSQYFYLLVDPARRWLLQRNQRLQGKTKITAGCTSLLDRFQMSVILL